jgi:hypothetical protein
LSEREASGWSVSRDDCSLFRGDNIKESNFHGKVWKRKEKHTKINK